MEHRASRIRTETDMALAKRTVEMLLDLVESRISYLDVLDLQDIRDLQILQQCREELQGSIEAGASCDELILRVSAARTLH